VREILGAIDAAESEIASARASPRGHLRVHAFPVVAAHELAPALPDFLARHPHITLDFMVTNRVVDLVGENVDVSCGWARSMTPGSSRARSSISPGSCAQAQATSPSMAGRSNLLILFVTRA